MRRILRGAMRMLAYAGASWTAGAAVYLFAPERLFNAMDLGGLSDPRVMLLGAFVLGALYLVGGFLWIVGDDSPRPSLTPPYPRRGNLSSPPPEGMDVPPPAMFTSTFPPGSGYQPRGTRPMGPPPQGGSGLPWRCRCGDPECG